MREKIKNFIKAIDFLGPPISFRYKKDEDKYSSILGGVISLLFILCYIGFGIIYFIQYVRMNKYNLIYNIINLPKADTVILNSSNLFYIGLECGNQQEKELNKYLDFKVIYYVKGKNKYGTFTKEKEEIPLISTNNTNNTNNTNLLSINKLYKTIKGKYGDSIFQYIEISLNIKKDMTEYINEIDKILFKNDCKLELHYTDYTLDYNIKKPLKEFKNEIFLQLNPFFCLKMNTFFMKQTLSNENDFLLKNKVEDTNKYIFSRSEQYFLYKGNNNTKKENRPKDYESYAKIYLRADSKRVEIKRKYETIFEFWADAFSLFDGLISISAFIFNSFYKFYIFYNIGNEIFFNKDNIHNLNFFQKREELKKMRDIIDKNINKENESISNRNLLQRTEITLNEEEKSNEKTINYSVKFYEVPMFIKYFNYLKLIRKCKCQNLKRKEALYSLQKDIIKRKLDISFYLKKMIYLDKLENKSNDSEDSKKNIFELLGKCKVSPEKHNIKSKRENIFNNNSLKLNNENLKNISQSANNNYLNEKKDN